MSNIAVDICQAKVTARVLPRQAGVVEAEQVQNRRVQVVQCHAILDRVVPELVGFAVPKSALYAAAGHPDRESVGVVISSDVFTIARL